MSSCTLKKVIHIADLTQVKNYLLDKSEETELEDEWSNTDWADNDWDKLAIEKGDEVKNESNWTQYCSVSVSPAMNFMCIYTQDKAIFLDAKSTSSDPNSSVCFSICWKGCLVKGDNIMSVLCLPLVSLQRSSHGHSDWTCVVVGFASGLLNMYTETGTLLMSQTLHDTRVVDLRCRTEDAASYSHKNVAWHKDELTVLYTNALVVVDGLSLFQTLRACRNQLAKATASGTSIISPPPLSYKKLRLNGQEQLTSHISLGSSTSTTFDQMLSASIIGGYHSDINPKAPKMCVFVTTGVAPFLGFYYLLEESFQPLLSHVASAVANKLKSALSVASGWWNWSKGGTAENPGQEKPEQKMERGTPLDVRFGLPDTRRQGISIVLAPSSNWLAAATDSFGRVLLIDLTKGSIYRMWKGYREAQVAFVRVQDDTQKVVTNSTIKKSALFLVVYAPRRGILEVWSCLYGPRVGAFNVSKNARLLSVDYDMLGASSLNTRRASSTFQCCLIDEGGTVNTLSIPFHLALSDSSSNRARDIHILKKVNYLLNSHSQDSNQIVKLLLEMRICAFQRQGVEKLVTSDGVSCAVIQQTLTSMLKSYNECGTTKEEKDFVGFLNSKLKLIDLFEELLKLNESSRDEEISKEEFREHFRMSEKEFDEMVELFDHYNKFIYQGQEDHKSEPVTVTTFLKLFVPNKEGNFNLQYSSDDYSNILALGDLIFKTSLFGSVTSSTLLTAIKDRVNIPDKDLLFFLLDYWQHCDQRIVTAKLDCNVRLLKFIEILTSQTSADHDTSSSWWNIIQNKTCRSSKRSTAVYTIALVCRAQVHSVELRKITSPPVEHDQVPPETDDNREDEQILPTSSSGGWESLTMDVESWKVLVKQLEDCLALNVVRAMAAQAADRTYSPASNVGVEDMLSNGTGYIPELLSELICASEISASAVASYFDHGKDDELSEKQSIFLDYLKHNLCRRFPLILTPNVLYAHCVWDKLVLWHKDTESVHLIRQCVDYLNLIQHDPLLQHGLALMAWRTFISKRFTSLAKLIDKVGKAPKDRLCRKEVGIGETNMMKFCEACTVLLQVIADADPDQFPQHPKSSHPGPEKDHLGILSSEDTWHDIRGKESIVDLAKAQHTNNLSLIQHNMNLAFILHAVMLFGLRGVKPLSQLFDSNMSQFFFIDLTSSSPILDRDVVGRLVVHARKQFLCKVVTFAVARIASQQEDDKEVDEMIQWIDTCVHMTIEFQLDRIIVQMHYAEELFRHGLDVRGHEALRSVNDLNDLGPKLVTLIGQRLSHYLKTINTHETVIALSQMTPDLSTWINEQKPSELPNPDVNISDTMDLARYVASNLSEDDPQHSRAIKLFQALTAITD